MGGIVDSVRAGVATQLQVIDWVCLCSCAACVVCVPGRRRGHVCKCAGCSSSRRCRRQEAQRGGKWRLGPPGLFAASPAPLTCSPTRATVAAWPWVCRHQGTSAAHEGAVLSDLLKCLESVAERATQRQVQRRQASRGRGSGSGSGSGAGGGGGSAPHARSKGQTASAVAALANLGSHHRSSASAHAATLMSMASGSSVSRRCLRHVVHRSWRVVAAVLALTTSGWYW